MTRQRDLTRSGAGHADDTRVVLVHDGDGGMPPVITKAFVNGQELLLSANDTIGLTAGSDDLFKVQLTLIPTSIELIDSVEMAGRLTQE